MTMATNCPQCGGGPLRDDEGQALCPNCGRRYEWPKDRASATGKSGGVELTVTLKPKDLPELFAALGMVTGKTGNQYLQSLGLAPQSAGQMMTGSVLYIEPLLKVMETAVLTPSDFVTLLKATKPAPKNKGGRPKKGEGK